MREADGDGRGHGGGGAVAELPEAVLSPGVEGAVGGEGVAVVETGRDGRRRDSRGQTGLGGRRRVGGRPVSQLAVAVVAPGVDVAVAAEDQAVVQTGGDCRAVASARHRDGDRRVLVRRGAVTELAVVVVPPRVDGACRAYGQAVVAAGSDGGRWSRR